MSSQYTWVCTAREIFDYTVCITAGLIHHQITLYVCINNKDTKETFLVVSLGGQDKVILRYPWLTQNNPQIDWEKGEVNLTGKASLRPNHVTVIRAPPIFSPDMSFNEYLAYVFLDTLVDQDSLVWSAIFYLLSLIHHLGMDSLQCSFLISPYDRAVPPTSTYELCPFSSYTPTSQYGRGPMDYISHRLLSFSLASSTHM